MTPLLTKRGAASVLAVSERTVTALTTSGRLPFVRVGKCVRIDPADLAAFIASRKSAGRSESHRVSIQPRVN